MKWIVNNIKEFHLKEIFLAFKISSALFVDVFLVNLINFLFYKGNRQFVFNSVDRCFYINHNGLI